MSKTPEEEGIERGMLVMIQGKVWGKTQLVHTNNCFEFHRIEFEKDHECSVHLHKTKSNGFFVESGQLLIRVWQDDDQDGLVDETIVNPGEFTIVPPMKKHQFVGLKSGVAFELYWAEYDPNDIVRFSIGKKCD